MKKGWSCFLGFCVWICACGAAPVTFPVDIRACANMGWGDEVADDGKGGWSDQGENDVHDLVPGKHLIHEVEFELADPALNGGASCMSFVGPSRDYFLSEAVIAPLDFQAEKLYILHALSWAPTDVQKIGAIEVTYSDGAQSVIDVKSNEDVCDWWIQARASNALIGWTGRNALSSTVLYLSAFDLDGTKKVAQLKFIPVGNAVWLVAAVSAGEEVSAVKPPQKTVIVAGEQWRPMDLLLEVQPGSALDFSDMNDAEAGTFGWVRAVGEQFEFTDRPGESVRFYGANLCWSANLLTKPQAEQLAMRLAAIGYNTVRIHHYDMSLTEKNGGKLDALDPEILDRLDYLIACLKKHGIYISLDLYTMRIPAPEDVAISVKDLHDFRAAIPMEESVYRNWQEFARLLLTHRNPYTGLEWRADPAIFTICTVNENLMPAPWRNHPELVKLYETNLRQWCAARGVEFPAAWEESPEIGRMILEQQSAIFSRMSAFLREELQVKALLTDNNNGMSISQTAERQLLDYADTHAYFEHPVFVEKPWELPMYYPQRSATADMATSVTAVPRYAMAGRILGAPYMITEFDYGFPNRHRGEGGLLIGAYGAFQNWNGLYRFSYSHFDRSMFKSEAGWMFETVRDPINLLSDRIGAVIFRRGDVAPAVGKIPFLFSPEDRTGYQEYPPSFSRLGLITGIGSLDATANRSFETLEYAVVTPAAAPVGGVKTLLRADDTLMDAVIQAQLIPDRPENELYLSDTGELALDAASGTFAVQTARAECFVLPAGSEAGGNFLKIRENDQFATFALLALKGESIEAADSLVLFHLTDVTNTDITFRDEGGTVLESWGRLPHLVRQGRAEISFYSERPIEVWALDMSGKRVAEIPVDSVGAWRSWSAATCNDFLNGVFAYEIQKGF